MSLEASKQPAKAKAEFKRLSRTEFERASVMWRSGDYTLEDISVKFGISVNGLYKRFKRNNVEKGEDNEVARKIHEENRASYIASHIDELSQLSVKVEHMIGKGVEYCERTRLKLLADAKGDKQDIASLGPAIKVLDIISRSMNKDHETIRELLKFNEKDKDPELPELVVSRMSDDDVDRLRKAQQAETDLILGKQDYLELEEGSEPGMYS